MTAEGFGFNSPISSAMQATLDDVQHNPGNERFGAVPLVLETVRPSVMGRAEIQDALFLCANPRSGALRLDSASKRNASVDDLGRLAYDLIEPLTTHEIAVDLGNIALKTMQAGYRSLGGVFFTGDPKRQTEFGLLIVPSIYKFGVYDLLDESVQSLEESREKMSTALTANILSWAIEHTIKL